VGRRFTIDGSDALEARLGEICERAAQEVRGIVPACQLEALILGGGYGRGEGGVLQTGSGDQAYNDLDFYVFLRGPHLWRRYNYGPRLHALGEHLSLAAGLDIEFKSDSLEKLRRDPISMFRHDLVAGHRVVLGQEPVFLGCEHHLEASRIPMAEATRLLFNRCSGLLLARELLDRPTLSADEADFVSRNLAKMQLALGDAVLTTLGFYHNRVRQRAQHLARLRLSEEPPWLEEVRMQHALGVEFKLHPKRAEKAGRAQVEQLGYLSALALQLWLWLESRRLDHPFASAKAYAFDGRRKCPETRAWRNYLLTLRTFGPGAALDTLACRYPRERLLNALSLLLWQQRHLTEPRVVRHLQKQLRTPTGELSELIRAYKRLWPVYS